MHDAFPEALPQKEGEIDGFIAGFEDGTLPKERWSHGAHILTGACYVHAHGEAAAIDRMRSKVSAYNVAVGGKNTPTSGYHETVTVLWIKILAQFYAKRPGMARAAFATLAVEHFAGQKDILRHYYDFDVVASTEARASWVSPTLISI